MTRFSRSFFFSCQMAEARGVPRGNYDGPVHDVISMTKSVPPTPTTRGPPCLKTLTGSRNLHQSGFTLAGREHIPSQIWSAGWIAFWVVQLSASYGIMTSVFHIFFLSRSTGWWPHTSSFHSEDCGTTWWTVQHYLLVIKHVCATLILPISPQPFASLRPTTICLPRNQDHLSPPEPQRVISPRTRNSYLPSATQPVTPRPPRQYPSPPTLQPHTLAITKCLNPNLSYK